MPVNKGIASKSVVSVLDAEINKREIDMHVGDIYKNNAFNDILMIGDRKEPITQIYYRTRIKEKTDFSFDTTGATVTGSGTGTIVTSTSDVNAVNYTRRNQFVFFSASGAVGLIQNNATVSGGRVAITIKIVKGTATHTAGEKLVLGGVASGEKGGATDTINEAITSYTNKYGIVTEACTITDVEKSNEIEITMKDGSNKYLQLLQASTLNKFKNDINKMLILSDISDTSFDDSNPGLTDVNTTNSGGGGGAIQTTRGLHAYAKTYGATPSVATLGTVGMADWDLFCDNLLAVRADQQLLAIGSNATRRACDKFIQNLPSSGALNSVRLNMDGNELDLTVDSFTYGGYKFKFAEMPLFNNDVVASHIASKQLYFLPENGRVETVDGGMKPTMALKYVKQTNRKGFGNEWILETEDGALAPTTPSGDARFYRTSYTTMLGFEHKAPTQIVMARVLS